MSYELYELQGTLLIGLTIGASLYGALCCQTLAYWRRFTADAAYIRLIVVAIWVLESVHTALVAHSVYYYVILHRGNFSSQIKPVWSIVIQMMPSSMAMGFTQFAWIIRIWTLNTSPRRNLIAFMMMMLLCADGGFAIAFLINGFHDAQWVDVKLNKLWLIVTPLLLLSVNNLLATGMLLYILFRTRMGIRKADTLVTQVVAFALHTGLLTTWDLFLLGVYQAHLSGGCSIGAVATLLLAVFSTSTLYYSAMFICLSKIYANSLLAMLNWRKSTLDGGSEEVELDQLTTGHLEMSSL